MSTSRRPLAATLTAALATTALAACSGSGDVGDGARAADRGGDWTVLVYMDADNNLEPAALLDLAEMTAAGDTDFVVLLDRAADYSTDDAVGLGDFTDSRLLRIHDGKVRVLDEPGEVNMGDPTTVADFVETALDDHRSDHNAFVVWNHGGAWRGSAWDEGSDNDNLTTEELTAGLQAGLSRTRVDTFDLVGFDACLMAEVSVAAGLAPVADYLVASEELEPGIGWDWSGVSASDAPTTQEFATRIAESYTTASAAAGIQDTTLSVIDLESVEEVASALDDVEEFLAGPGSVDVVGRVAAARSRSLSFGKSANPAQDYWLVDLGNLAEGLSEVAGAGDAAERLATAVDEAVVHGSYGPSAADATGIGFYFPSSASYRDAAYDGPGAGLIDAFYARAAAVPDAALPRFTDEDRRLPKRAASVDADAVTLSADVAEGTGGNIASADMFWGRRDGTSAAFFGRTPAEVDADADTVSGTYAWNVLTLADATGSSPAFADLGFSPSGDLARVSVPVRYLRGGVVPLRGRLVLSMADGQVAAATFYLTIVGGGVSAITPGAADTFVPLVLNTDLATQEATWEPASDVRLSATNALTASYSRAPSGTPVLVGLSLVGVTGLADLVVRPTTVP